MVMSETKSLTMVEVSLVEGANAVQKQKSCWFPFKNHMKNRKSITAGPGPGPKMVANNWDVDGLDISDNKNRYNTEHNKSQRFHRNNAKTKGSSVSTGTITDTSFQSEESPGGTRSYNSSHDSSSRSKASSSRNTSANFSYQSNSNSILENSHHRNEHGDELELEDPYFLDEDFDDDGSIVANDRYANPKKKQQSTEQRLGDVLPVPDMDLDLATLETNCSTKEFWVDEMVEGGAFSCLQEREKVSNSNDTKLNESEDSGASTTNGYPDLSRDSEESNRTITHPLGRIMRFVSQDPEDSNDGAPLRRVLCSAISLRNGHNPMLCRNREETRRQDEQNPTTTKVWKENQIGTIVNHHDEEAPNFFVEVEARREHLDGVRELEEIQAENDEFEEDIAIARTASLVDEDSAFMESSNGGMNRNNVLKHAFLPPLGQSDNSETFSLSSKKLVKNIISGAKATNNESKNLQSMDSSVSFDNGNIASRLPIMNSDQGNRDFQREKMDRQDKLMSEMVTDRVLAMQVDNGIISDSILRDKDEFMITQTECKLRDESMRSGSRSRERQIERKNQSLLNDSISIDSPPRIIKPSAPVSILNPINISELTDSSFDRVQSKNRTSIVPTKQKNKSRSRKTYLDTTRPGDSDVRKTYWEESDIGYFRRVDSASYRSSNAVFSPRCVHDTGETLHIDNRYDWQKHQAGHFPNEFSPTDALRVQSDVNTKFDDNFWKEDTDSLNTEAFEIYGSEGGSLFDDL